MSRPNQMYETYEVSHAATKDQGSELLADTINSTANLVPGTFTYTANSPETSDYILYVHGWRELVSWKQGFADTTYKRLFWQGYKGRFGAFDWPTEFVDTNVEANVGNIGENYYRSEEKAYWSAIALNSLLLNLDNDYGAQHINLFAHSLGNVVAGEALRIEARSSVPQQIVNTYIASQAAVSSHAYDPTAGDRASHNSSPDVYASFAATNKAYFAPITTGSTPGAVAGKMINFFNPLDSILGFWCTIQDNKTDGQTHTADANGFYEWTDFTHSAHVAPPLSLPSDRYEIFSYAAASWSTALGATPGVGGPFDTSLEVDLSTAFPAGQNFTNDRADHPIEFKGTYSQHQSYWKILLQRMGLSN